MILVFILLGIVTFLLVILFITLISTLKIEVKDLSLSNIEENETNLKLNNVKEKKKASYIIKISLNLFGSFKWLWISLDSKKVKKLISKIPKIDIKKFESDFKLADIKVLKKLHLKISKLKLNAILGLESPITTAFLIAILSSSISIVIPYLVKKLNKENYEYNIQPIYNNQNLYKIKLNCIIELKMVHIMNVIYILIKKGKRDKNERTASNRKSYAYSHE